MSDLHDHLRLSAAYWSAATRFTRDRLRSARRLGAALARHLQARADSLKA